MENTKMKHENKTAVVLGATRENGAGIAIARKLAEEGAHVTVAGRSGEGLEVVTGNAKIECMVCDITDENSLKALATSAAERTGKIDIAVNCAGAYSFSLVAKLSAEKMQRDAEVHLTGTALFIKAMTEKMQGGGAIVTLSSTTALIPAEGTAAYAASKAGADHLVRIAALEYGPLGIRINSLAPGLMHTPMTDAVFASAELVGLFENETPLRKLANTQDVAAACSWLVSDDCISTGEVLQVNAGATLGRLPNGKEMRSVG